MRVLGARQPRAYIIKKPRRSGPYFKCSNQHGCAIRSSNVKSRQVVYSSLEKWRMVGVEGFEPPNNGVKVRRLTTWPHPNIHVEHRVWISREMQVLPYCEQKYLNDSTIYILYRRITTTCFFFFVERIFCILCFCIFTKFILCNLIQKIFSRQISSVCRKDVYWDKCALGIWGVFPAHLVSMN